MLTCIAQKADVLLVLCGACTLLAASHCTGVFCVFEMLVGPGNLKVAEIESKTTLFLLFCAGFIAPKTELWKQ